MPRTPTLSQGLVLIGVALMASLSHGEIIQAYVFSDPPFVWVIGAGLVLGAFVFFPLIVAESILASWLRRPINEVFRIWPRAKSVLGPVYLFVLLLGFFLAISELRIFFDALYGSRYLSSVDFTLPTWPGAQSLAVFSVLFFLSLALAFSWLLRVALAFALGLLFILVAGSLYYVEPSTDWSVLWRSSGSLRAWSLPDLATHMILAFIPVFAVFYTVNYSKPETDQQQQGYRTLRQALLWPLVFILVLLSGSVLHFPWLGATAPSLLDSAETGRLLFFEWVPRILWLREPYSYMWVCLYYLLHFMALLFWAYIFYFLIHCYVRDYGKRAELSAGLVIFSQAVVFYALIATFLNFFESKGGVDLFVRGLYAPVYFLALSTLFLWVRFAVPEASKRLLWGRAHSLDSLYTLWKWLLLLGAPLLILLAAKAAQ